MCSTSQANEEHGKGNNCSFSNGVAAVRILIADDHAANRQIMVNILQVLGCRLEVVANGREAVHAWERGDFDLILMDIQMPVLDGLEATRIIRNHEEKRGGYTPIIAHSADTSKEGDEVFLSLRFDGFVRKPVVIGTLMREIDRCLQLKRSRPE